MSYVDKVKAMIASRRFQATVASVLTIVFQDVLGLMPEQALVVAGIIQTWVVGDSITKT